MSRLLLATLLACILCCTFVLWTTSDLKTVVSGGSGSSRYVRQVHPAEESRLFWSSLRFKPWFLSGGLLRPDPESPVFSNLAIWPEQEPASDRIADQLMYLPPGYDATKVVRNKKIFLFYGRGNSRDLPLGQERFLRDNCPVNTCELSTDRKDIESADAVFFKVSRRGRG